MWTDWLVKLKETLGVPERRILHGVTTDMTGRGTSSVEHIQVKAETLTRRLHPPVDLC